MSKAIITEQHLHDIADAIIAKGGATAAMTPAQMPAAIQSIPSGVPNQGGIPDEGWKNDGASHFWNYGEEDGWAFQICIGKVFGAPITIAWGDGQSETLNVFDSNRIVQHVYAKSGAYRVDVTSGDGGSIFFSQGSIVNIAGEDRDNGSFLFSSRFTHIELGSNANQTGGYGQAAAMINLRGFRSRCVGEDSNVMFKCCQSLKVCDIGDGWTKLNYCFSNGFIYKVNEIVIPASVTQANGMLYSSRGIRTVRFASGSEITTLTGTFRNCSTLEYIEIPSSVTTISGFALNIVWQKDVSIHFKGITPPTFSDSSSVAVHSTAKFYVPYSADHSVLAAYKAAPNLSVYASQIYEEEES